MKKSHAVLIFVGIFLVILAMLALTAFVLMLIWNGLAGYFGFKPIDFGIAMLIVIAIAFVASFFKKDKDE